MDTKDILINGLKSMGISIDDITAEKFMKYKSMLQEWNQKINLTSIVEDNEIIIKHFLDSASIIGLLGDKKSAIKIADVGTGAGFPGIPVKLLNPEADVLLLDSLNKRIKFLNEVISENNLSNINSVHIRAEDAGRDGRYREKFDVVVSRAVARLSVLSEYCMPLVKVKGKFIAMKGPDISQEISEAEKGIKTLGGEIADVKSVLLPFSDIKHTLIVIKKLRQTSGKYPRSSAQISKNPIK